VTSSGGVNAFIDNLFQNSLAAAQAKDLTDPSVRAARVERLQHILRIQDLSSDPLAPVILERIDCGDHIRERVEIGTVLGLRMPVYLLLPKHGSAPKRAVLALHGHGYGSRELVGLGPDGSAREEGDGIHKHFALSLVRQGFIAVVPELLGFGGRRLTEDASQDKTPEDQRESSCYKLSSYLLHLGRTLAGIRTREVLCALDYIVQREEVMTGGVGSMGLSGGAFVGYLAAALDERISASVLSGYPNTYSHSRYFATQHCLCDYVPDVIELGDMPDIISLIAPRAVMLETGNADPLFPLAGVLAAAERIRKVYEAELALPRFKVEIFEGKHEIAGGTAAYSWLHEQLEC